MTRRYLATLAGVAVAILAGGLTIRGRLAAHAPAAVTTPPSEASALQQLSQEVLLRRTAERVAERVGAAAPRVTWVPATDAAGVRWRGDTVLSTSRDHAVVAAPSAAAGASATPGDAASADLVVDTASAADDLAGWTLVVGRRADGTAVSTAALAGGRATGRCDERDVRELTLGVALDDRFAGAGVFTLDGRVLGLVVRCGDRLAAIAAADVERLLADASSPERRVRAALGLETATLDARSRAAFGADSGVLVVAVRRGTPADAAGLAPGDLLLASDGAPLASPADLAALGAGTRAVVRRRGAAVSTVRLAVPAPNAPRDTATAAGFGVDVSPPARGVPITEVRPGSLAAAAGLRAGDRLLRVDDAPVVSAAGLRRLLGGRTPPRFLVFERGGVARGVFVPPQP